MTEPVQATAANHPILVEEVAVAITINGINHAVMLTSPFDLEAFAIGFLYSEQLINALHDIRDIEIKPQAPHFIVEVELANRVAEQYRRTSRLLKGTSGCGLCGKTALAHALPTLPKLEPSTPPDSQQLQTIRAKLSQHQTQAKHTGALHAAFYLDQQLTIQACKEDIGRHNALDKLIGYALTNKLNRQQASLLVTSRCSIELVQKAIRFGASNLISLASPSQLALETAKAHGLNLIQLRKIDAPVYF